MNEVRASKMRLLRNFKDKDNKQLACYDLDFLKILNFKENTLEKRAAL